MNATLPVPEWIQSSLTAEQLAPFTRDEKHACIFASAGSGKTRTLVHMLARDLVQGVAPENIIAFTFTERAANEMRARVHALVREHMPDVDITKMYVGTIHAWCFQYLLEQQDFYGYTALDELNVDALVSRLYDSLNLEKAYRRPFPKAVTPFITDLDVFYNEHLSIADVPESIRPAIMTFRNLLDGNRLLPFGAMITAVTDYLRQHGPLAHLDRLYCDEYQDVNPAQVSLIQAMLGDSTRFTAVGDDLQCIFQWRGSDVSRILRFRDDFPDSAVFRLRENFRSRSEIVQCANDIAEDIVVKDPKVMVACRPASPIAPIRWITTSDDNDQAAVIGDAISRLIREGVPASKIAILIRSVVRQGRPIADELHRRGIPFESPILGRSGGFIESFLLPIVEWLTRDHNGPRSEAEEVALHAQADALWGQARIWLPSGDGTEDRFWDALNDWRQLIASSDNRAYDVRGRLYDFLDACGLRVNPTTHDVMAGLGIGTQIIRSVEEIHRRRLSGFKRRTPKGVMTEVLYALRRVSQRFGESEPVSPSADAVLITTIHQAKGLEWPVVIVPSLDQDRFPLRPQRQRTSFPDAIAARYGTSLEDERRLFYVAATRARERLILVDTDDGSSLRRSRFLIDLAVHGAYRPCRIGDVPHTYWSIAASDLVDKDPEPLSIGLSDLLMAVECAFQYGLRRRANMQPSITDELGYGAGLHELIQRRFESPEAWSQTELENQTSRHVHLPYMSDSGEKQARAAIKDRLSAFERLGVFDDRQEAEVRIAVTLPGGVVSGIIDGVFTQADASVSIKDWKSNIHPEFLTRYERQLQFYAYALRQRGVNVVGADLVDVGASTKKGQLAITQVDIAPSTVTQLMSLLALTIRDIERGAFTPNPTESGCGACDMRRICEVRWRSDDA